MGKPLVNTKIIQITSGRGPAECCWVVAQILKHFLEAVNNKNIDCKILHREKGIENMTLQSVTVQLKGSNLNRFLSQWTGTIQWIGTSTFRPQHKRKNWFVGLYEISKSEQFEILDKDITYQATKSSGPGGQHVNKVASKVELSFNLSESLVFSERQQTQR